MWTTFPSGMRISVADIPSEIWLCVIFRMWRQWLQKYQQDIWSEVKLACPKPIQGATGPSTRQAHHITVTTRRTRRLRTKLSNQRNPVISCAASFQQRRFPPDGEHGERHLPRCAVCVRTLTNCSLKPMVGLLGWVIETCKPVAHWSW